MARKIILLFLCSVSWAVCGAEVFKWVDEYGKVHYGESVPERYKQKAKKVELTGTAVGGEGRQEAEARAAKEKARAESLQRKREPQAGTVQSDSPPLPDVPQARDECQEQLKEYLASVECFAPYQLKGGAVRPEAFQQCKQVKEPRGCFAPPRPADRPHELPTLPR